MIRLTWMQFRLQALVGGAALAVFAIVLAITGPSLHHLYTTTVLDCHANGDCSTAASIFLGNDGGLQAMLNVVVEIVPALIGLFWGAPLVAREFEANTYRLVWTETTRARWIAIKLAVIGLLSVGVAGVLSLIVTWWSSPLDAARMTPFLNFDQRGVVPLAYAAFAFILGVTAGLLIRKTLPAMASALVVFVAARLAVAHWARPYLLSPLRLVVPDTAFVPVGSSPASAQAPNLRDWVISDQTINASGHVIGAFGTIGSGIGSGAIGGLTAHGVVLGRGYSCPNIAPPSGPIGSVSRGQVSALVENCVKQLHIREVLTYQPINHYWPIQWCEFGIFLIAALLLGGFCLWRVRGRVA